MSLYVFRSYLPLARMKFKMRMKNLKSREIALSRGQRMPRGSKGPSCLLLHDLHLPEMWSFLRMIQKILVSKKLSTLKLSCIPINNSKANLVIKVMIVCYCIG